MSALDLTAVVVEAHPAVVAAAPLLGQRKRQQRCKRRSSLLDPNHRTENSLGHSFLSRRRPVRTFLAGIKRGKQGK